MAEKYTVTLLEEVINQNDCIFYKLYIEGKCLFDEFLKEIERDIKTKDALDSIYALMDKYSTVEPLPKQKFNHIICSRKDVYEFKHKKPAIRVFVIKQDKNVYVIMGSRKNEQTKAIKRIDSRFKDFPRVYEPIQMKEDKI